MKRIPLFLLLFVSFSFTSLFGQYSAFIPNWKVGDSWVVETKPIAFGMPKRPGRMMKKRVNKTEKVFFKVIKREKVDGVSCLVIHVTNTAMPRVQYYLYIRERDYTLKRFVEKYGDSKRVIDNPSKPFVLEDMGILCPFDFPKFPNREEDHVLRTKLGVTDKKLIQMVSFNKDKTMMRVEIRTTVNGRKLKSIQIWKKGAPWWIRAERYLGDEKWEMGTLKSWKLAPRRFQVR